MSKNYFYFNGEKHYLNTIVEIYDDKREEFDYAKKMRFTRVDDKCGELCFCESFSGGKCYRIKESDVNKYIEKVVVSADPPLTKAKPQDRAEFGTVLIWVTTICFASLFIVGGWLPMAITLGIFACWWCGK